MLSSLTVKPPIRVDQGMAPMMRETLFVLG